MAALLDMSKVPLPDAVTLPEYAALRMEYLTGYATRRGVAVEDLDDNDPAVHVLEEAAYRHLLLIASNNDSIRNTLLTHAHGGALDDLALEPLYGGGTLARLVIDEGDEDAVPPIPPVMESDDAFRERLRLAPQALSVAGPAGAYEVRARSAHADAVDVRVTSPDPCEILVEVLHNSEDANILAKIEAALSADSVRPLGDRVTVQAAARETSSVDVTVYVPDGPDLAAVQAAAQARVDALVLPLCAKVGSGAFLSEGDPFSWLGACQVEGVQSWEVTAFTGMSDPAEAWWPMTITVTAVRSNV